MDDTIVKVAVRIRPQSAREILDMCQVCTHVVPEEPQIVLGRDKSFTFDHVFVSGADQEEVYERCCAELITGTFEGYNATIIAYGQTGSGKTYTMGTGFDVGMSLEQAGIIPRAVKHLFDGIEQRTNNALTSNNKPPDFKVNAQFMELYNEEINDLLDSTRDTTEKCKKSLIRVHEGANGGIYTVGAITRPVASLEDTMECLKIGALLRSTGSTHMNVQSSRSHAIFTLHIRQQRSAKDKNPDDCEAVEMLSAKFHFVDLAGSERLKRTGATGDRAKEGISINCGLLALGNVISALGDKAKRGTHVPYRDSKLTRLLQDSLGGNSRTLMIACVSPSDRDFVETLNTLKYANRARNIKNKVTVNQDMSSKQLSALRCEIQALQRELMEFKLGRRSMESSLSSVSVMQSSDMSIENQLLSKEIDGLRSRVKSLQQTVETLTIRNAQLISDKDSALLTLTDASSNDEVKKLIDNYVKEMEELRAGLIESESALEAFKSSQRANRLVTSPINPLQKFNKSPNEQVKDVISVAQKDLDVLKNKFKMRSISQEGDVIIGDENEDADAIEEELKESEDESSENENQTSCITNSDLADLTCEISIKEKLVEELKLSQQRMRTLQVQYEEKMRNLEEKIRETQRERDVVIANMENIETSSEEKSRKVKEEYERKLCELHAELKKLEVVNKSHTKVMKEHSLVEKQCKTMQQELLELKKQKVQLMNKMKEESQKNRQLELQRDKEINQLRKSQRMKDNQIKTMEAERRQKEIVLKRKQEEVESLRKRNRPVMSARVLGQPTKEGVESMRPRRPSKFPNKSSKAVWNDIEKSIASLVSKKQTLGCMEKDMDRWIKQRNRLRKKLETLQEKMKSCENEKDLRNHVVNVKENISYIQENILSCQANIMQLEEGKEEDGDPLKRLIGCSPAQLRYLLEYSINSLISKGLTVVEKEAENKELSAKLHQHKMDNTYQRDVLQILIQDNENIEIDESLLSPRDDSDEDENEEEEEEEEANVVGFRKDKEQIIASSTPIRNEEEDFSIIQKEVQKFLGSLSSPMFDHAPVEKKEKARRKTSTPEELLFVGHGNPIFETITEFETIEELKDKGGEIQDAWTNFTVNSTTTTTTTSRLKHPGNKDSNYAGTNENTNNSKKNMRQTEPHQIPKKKPLSASSSFGSDTIGRTGSAISTNNDTTPPTSPGVGKKSKDAPSNVFSRLYSRDQFNSPFPAKGVIKSSSSKSNQNFPLTNCHTAYGHVKAVLSLFATDNYLFSGSKDRTAKMWDLKTGEEILTLGIHLNNVVSIKYSEHSGLVYTASTYLIRLWDPRQGGVCIKSLASSGQISESMNNLSAPVTRSHTCPQGENSIADFCISTSANNLYSAVGNYVKIWDMRMHKVVGRLCGGNQAAIMALAIDDTDTADGNTCIVTGSKDHYIKVYEIMEDVTGNVIPKCNLIPPHYDGIQSLCLKGDFLFSGSRDTCIKKWDLADKEMKQSINNAHKDWICGLTFLPSSNCFLSACRAGVMKIWNVDNCNLIGETQAHSGPINDITSNSQMIFSASNDNSIQFWKTRENLDLLEFENEF